MRESRDSYRILVGKPEGNGYSLGDPIHGGKTMSKCIFGFRVGTWWAVVKTVTNLQVSYNAARIKILENC